MNKKTFLILITVFFISAVSVVTVALADSHDRNRHDDDDDRDEYYEDDDDHYDKYDNYKKDYDDDDDDYDDDDRDEYYEDDDDHHDKYDNYKKDDDDDYDYDDDYDDNYYTEEITRFSGEVGTWNLWTRTIVGQKEELPFTEAQNVQIKRQDTNTTMNVYVIPRNGELFVPGKTMAQFLGAEATFYPTSQIVRITNVQDEIILRAQTNVVYENRVKTPMPALAFYLNQDVYVPISVVVNSLGYYVEWQADQQTFICQTL